MKIGVVIQARMTSTRLPGKVLMPIYKSKSMLELVVERVSKSKLVDEIIIATTKNRTDDPIIGLCEKLGINYHRGSEDNVLERYYEAAQKYELDVIIRITSDCPVIDWETIDRIIEAFQSNSDLKYDYVSNIIERTYPRGLDTELMTFKTLEKTYKMAETVPEKEHVTRRILVTHPEEYRKLNIKNSFSIDNMSLSEFRLTVDTPEDKELIERIYEKLDKVDFTQKELIDLLINNPELPKINQQIQQKII